MPEVTTLKALEALNQNQNGMGQQRIIQNNRQTSKVTSERLSTYVDTAKGRINEQIRSSTDGAFKVQITGGDAVRKPANQPNISRPLSEYIRIQEA